MLEELLRDSKGELSTMRVCLLILTIGMVVQPIIGTIVTQQYVATDWQSAYAISVAFFAKFLQKKVEVNEEKK